MLPREIGPSTGGRPVTLTGNFSVEEMERLTELRDNFYSHAEYLERVIDNRRFEFARWLLEHGKLTEGTPEA